MAQIDVEVKSLNNDRRKIDGTHIWEKSEKDTYDSMDYHDVYAAVVFDAGRV